MTDILQAWLYATKDQGIIKNYDKVLDVGSLVVDYHYQGARPVFYDAKEYIGIDIEEGLGVDRIVDMHELSKHFEPEYFDLVVCTEVFEHDPKFWVTLEEIKKVLKPGGYFLFSVPNAGEYHPYPKDYWRFMQDGITDVVLDGYKNRHVGQVGSALAGWGVKK